MDIKSTTEQILEGANIRDCLSEVKFNRASGPNGSHGIFEGIIELFKREESSGYLWLVTAKLPNGHDGIVEEGIVDYPTDAIKKILQFKELHIDKGEIPSISKKRVAKDFKGAEEFEGCSLIGVSLTPDSSNVEDKQYKAYGLSVDGKKLKRREFGNGESPKSLFNTALTSLKDRIK